MPAVAMCLNAGQQQRLDPTFETLIPTNRCGFDVAHSLRAEGFDAGEDGTGRGTPIVPVAHCAPEIREVAPTLTQNYGKQPDSSDTNAGPILIPVAYQTSGNCGAWETGDKVGTLTQSTDPNAHVIAHAIQAGALRENPNSGPVGGNQGGDFVQDAWAVRRLTVRECERLQGFPDDFTAIIYRGKPPSDGPRYKSLGNSWAVPCGAWILSRTARAILAAKEKA